MFTFCELAILLMRDGELEKIIPQERRKAGIGEAG